MNNPLGVSPSKGKQGTTQLSRQSGERSNPEVVGSIPTEIKRFFLCPVGRVTEDLIRRTWVRFSPRSKDFFFASCGSLFPFTRANAQWVIHGFK